MRQAVQRTQPLALSAISWLEIAVLFAEKRYRLKGAFESVLSRLETDPGFQILPVSPEIASEVHAMGGPLRDPADRAIVATARVHGLRLITSDQRIIESELVPVVD